MANKYKKPEIRFRDFEDGWERQELRKVVNLENGFAFKSQYFQNKQTDFIVLTPGNVHVGGGFQKEKGHYYDKSGEFPSRFIFKPGEIFVTMTDLTPSAQTLGFPAEVPDDGKIYLHNQRLGKVTNYEGEKKFLLQLLSTERNHKQIVSTASGTTVKHTSPEKILNCINYFPSKEEQSKVGTFFQNLDKLLNFHQQKYNILTILKKAMLEKMFPKEGADVPESRFKGFTGAWKEKELGKLAIFSKGQGYSKSDLVKEGTPIILYGRLYTNYQAIIREVDTHVIEKKGSVYSEGSEVIVPASGETAADIARASAVAKAGILLGGDLNVIYPNEEIDSAFLALSISNGKSNNELVKRAQGKSVVHLRKSDLEEVGILYPDKEEQQKISAYFQNLDNLITQHQTQLAKLKNIKKACLEKMFV